MTETEQPANPTPKPSAPPAAESPNFAPESVIIRPWPKVVFLYPTFVAATIFFLLSWLGIGAERAPDGTMVQHGSVVLGNTFMAIVFLNLLVFSFDFSRIKSITILVGIVAAVLLVLWIDSKWEVTSFLGRVADSIDIRMNTGFYGFFSAGMAFLLVLVFVNTRFHYYEVNAREILHHHGYLGDVRRWSTEGLEMNKEIYDVAEYILLRSGRLIFNPMTSKKAVVVVNVVSVNRIEKSINDLLSHVAVRINQRPGPG